MCSTLIACSQDISYRDTQGHEIKLSQLAGKWLIINYWASWCRPCYEELPELNAFYRQNKDKNVVLLGVNYDQVTPDKLPELMKRMHIQFPVLTRDPAAELGIQHVPGLPATYVFSPDGTLRQRLLGRQTQKTLQAAIQ